MDIKLEQHLVTKYPNLLQGYGGDPRQTCLAFGFEVGNGWYDILDELLGKLSKFPDIVILQVKEKLGELRVYMGGTPDEAMELVIEAERKSRETCEQCGRPGKLRGTGWYYTACDECTKNWWEAPDY